MESVTKVGQGYYNYYHVKNRYETEDGKAKECWYDKDVSKLEIQKDNLLNSEYENADLMRKARDKYSAVAEVNRKKYNNVDDLKNAVYAKYTQGTEYQKYSIYERFAMAKKEIDVTMFGTVSGYSVLQDPTINNEKSQYSVSSADESSVRSFNISMLSKQISNVFNNNGIDLSQLGNNKLKFSINAYSQELSVSLLNSDDKSSMTQSLLEQMTTALNSNNNSNNLFYNILYDGNKQGILAKDQLSKWKLFSDFNRVTGLDLRNFTQTTTDLVDDKGRSISDIYRDELKTTDKVPREFKGVAFAYFQIMKSDALKYDLKNIPDLTLSLEYQNGQIKLNGNKQRFETTA